MTALQLMDASATEGTLSGCFNIYGVVSGGFRSSLYIENTETQPLPEHHMRCPFGCLFVALSHACENLESRLLLWLAQSEACEKSYGLLLALLSWESTDVGHNLADVKKPSLFALANTLDVLDML
jgi:hypothetical protein